MSFTVVIVGRPNVGKSTLFNRLVGRRLAIVDDRPGVTRDRREGQGRLGPLRFTVVDTAGLEEAAAGDLAGRMAAQAEAGLLTADVALFLIDARTGVTPADRHFARRLRAGRTPVVLVANKAEGGAGEGGLLDAFSLGFGEPVALSAEHGEGLADLYQQLVPFAREDGEVPPDAAAARPIRVAVVGRPNVGKSTLINRLLGEERVLTGPEPGLTRDSITVPWEHGGQRFELVDTAGLRRRARVTDAIERLATADTRHSIAFAQVVVLLLDATQPLERQDLVIGGLVAEEGRALVVAANKWDLVADRRAARRELRASLDESLAQVRGVTVVELSALTGAGTERLPPALVAAHAVWNQRVPTGALNDWLATAIAAHPPPMVQGRRPRLGYMTQAATRPPTFVLFGRRLSGLPEAYRRYLMNGLRESFALPGTPIRLHTRESGSPR